MFTSTFTIIRKYLKAISGDHKAVAAIIAVASACTLDAYSPAPLEPIPFELPEVKVSTKHRPILHLTGYIREISKMASSIDTLMLYREKWVDFMIPSGKAKYFRGWTDPRLLKTKSYYKWTDPSGLDSVSDRTDHHFSWSDWVSLPRRINYPESIGGTRIGDFIVMNGDSIAEIWKKDSIGVNITVNVLADSIKDKWTPRLAGPMWRNHDFKRIVMDFRYSDTDTFSVRPQNLDRMSCRIESMGRGHDMFRFNRWKEDYYLYVTTYFDLTITDREYLTVKDAKRKEKDARLAIEDAMIIFESERVPRDSIINDLIARVNSIDHDSRRLAMEPDTRVGNGHLPAPPVYRRKDKIKRAVKSVLSGFGF